MAFLSHTEKSNIKIRTAVILIAKHILLFHNKHALKVTK